MPSRLFTPRFFLMFAYSFAVFLSVFQLLPAAPYRIVALDGTTAVAGLFQGVLTYSSALSAPFTGSIADRIGHRPVLIAVSLMLAVITAGYAVISNYQTLLVVAFVHGVIWSALLAASGAYMTATIPAARRAEGLGYWGLASVLAVGVAPALGFWVYRHGWAALCLEIAALNLVMAFIAWRLPDDRTLSPESKPELADIRAESRASTRAGIIASHVEWRVLVLSIGLALVTYAYGALTSFSALFADALSIAPRSEFLTVMAVAILLVRLTVGRRLDALGHRRVLFWGFLPPVIGLALLSLAQGPVLFVTAAAAFGAGFGVLHPAYTAYMLAHVQASRRGAAFGAMLAAFDTGIGSGSSFTGWLVHAFGFRVAFGAAAALAALALPSFLLAERRLKLNPALRPGPLP